MRTSSGWIPSGRLPPSGLRHINPSYRLISTSPLDYVQVRADFVGHKERPLGKYLCEVYSRMKQVISSPFP